MMTKTAHSIMGCQEAAKKLLKVFLKKYPNVKDTKMDIGLDPMNGKFMVVVFLKDRKLANRFPETVDGYRIVIDGVTSLLPDEDLSQ